MKRLDLLMKMIRYHLEYMNAVLGHQPRGLISSPERFFNVLLVS